jgi:tRNA A-37 threonylcarbamoyl transferase component Bud32
VRSWVTPDGRPIFEKRYRQDGQTQTLKVIRSRMAREEIVSQRLTQVPNRNPRLGIPRTLEFDFDGARIIMEKAPGKPLFDWLSDSSNHPSMILRGMYLSGAWLRMFQSLPILDSDHQLEVNDPIDPVLYCRPRVERIVNAGRWINESLTPEAALDKIAHWFEIAAPEDTALCWSHCDYAPFNLLWDGHVLTGIDLAMARLEPRLADVTYFIHRLEMLVVQRPWKRLPIEKWKRAFLRGYGVPDAEQSPTYTALMVRHCLNRMGSMIRRPGKGLLRRVHEQWLMRAVRARLKELLAQPPDRKEVNVASSES